MWVWACLVSFFALNRLGRASLGKNMPPECVIESNGRISAAKTTFDDANEECWDEFNACVQNNASSSCVYFCDTNKDTFAASCRSASGTYCGSTSSGTWGPSKVSFRVTSATCLPSRCMETEESDVEGALASELCSQGGSCKVYLSCNWRVSDTTAMGIILGSIAGILVLFVAGLVGTACYQRMKYGPVPDDLEEFGLGAQYEASTQNELTNVWTTPDDMHDGLRAIRRPEPPTRKVRHRQGSL